MTAKYEIVIPIYNDYESLQDLINLIAECTSDEISFLIVDNGSTEPKISELFSKATRNWRGVTTKENLGFGGGILFGMAHSDSPWIGWMPGNLKTDPRDVEAFVLGRNLNPRSILKGKRVNRSQSSHLKTFLAGLVQSLFLRKNMFDSGGTPTICHRSFLKGLENAPKDYVFESYILFLARVRGFEVIRPKINYGKRKYGNSHWQNGLQAEIRLMIKIIKGARQWKKASG